MLKMTIDNEEVVSDKDITINEEMLSASSTILNNVYPKEWEEDKDYTSKFYYPQDYSKALIQRSYVTQEAEAGTTIQVNGSVTLTDVDTTKNSRVLRLLGQTSQTGTPTPTNPIPVNVVSGDNEIIINSKNQLETYNISGTFNGVSYTLQDGVLTLNGTCTSTGGLTGLGIFRQIKGINYKWTYVYESGTCTDYGGGLFMGATPTSTSSVGYGAGFRASQSRTVASITNGEEHTYYLYLTVNKNSTFTNYKIKPLIVQGNDYSYDFEPYQGNTYNIDLPVENLFDKDNAEVGNGYINNDGDFASSQSNKCILSYTEIKPNTQYTLTYNGLYRIVLYDSNKVKTVAYPNISSPYTFTTTSDTKYIRISGDINIDLDTIQLEKGSKANSYTPFGTTPIELCKIGNYQDYIYKEDDKWYLHKEIGKVTYNGTETFTNPSSIETPTPRHSFQGSLNFIRCLNNNYLSNYFIKDNTGSNRFVITFSGGAGSDCTVFIALENSITGITSSDTNATKIQKLKDWLSTHNTVVYYPLATPTNTEITDTNLINQLNALSSQ